MAKSKPPTHGSKEYDTATRNRVIQLRQEKVPSYRIREITGVPPRTQYDIAKTRRVSITPDLGSTSILPMSLQEMNPNKVAIPRLPPPVGPRKRKRGEGSRGRLPGAQTLSDQQRSAVVTLRVFENKSYDAIEASLGVKPGTASNIVRKAKERAASDRKDEILACSASRKIGGIQPKGAAGQQHTPATNRGGRSLPKHTADQHNSSALQGAARLPKGAASHRKRPTNRGQENLPQVFNGQHRPPTTLRAPYPIAAGPSSAMSSLTNHLFKHKAPVTFQSATRTPFLRLAGQGKVPKALLAQWLAQDKLYALAYIRFAAALLSKGRLEDLPAFNGKSSEVEDNSSEQGGKRPLLWRISTCLIGALQNIQREIGFFEDVSRRYGLNLEGAAMAPETRAYIALFDRIATEAPLLEGLVVLWATEKCYFKAWKYASSFLAAHDPSRERGERNDEDGGALRKELIPNWTNEAFGTFVAELEGLVDELAGIGTGQVRMEACESVWREVLMLEEKFWPAILEV